ncbi:MAG: U32 family peptidase [Candidatus Muirbacterium halophilum]|nr:U32 family peptidase [Candidatus Muirbacterium halophilum]MCK9474576.1 U32 family peptidase [Candidatus Muirbacterium halophilum]
MVKKPELLAPAGDFEKMKFAFAYGADAVYLGGKEYSLRKKAKNFSNKELEKAIDYAHFLGKKVYVTVNSFYRDDEFENIEVFLKYLADIKADAAIISDPGLMLIIKEKNIKIPVHVSTQSNTTNSNTVRLWENLGAERVILARELTQKNIRDIILNSNIEIETFVHGAMCVSYSGRCLLSSFMAGRDSNKGDCAQPCRWKYKLYYLEEDKRKGKFMPVIEDDTGTYIMNSADLNLSRKIPELINAGVCSLKIEGRMKSSYYVAMVCRIYRQIIDEYIKNPEIFEFKEEWADELKKISHRNYTEAAFDENFNSKDQVYKNNYYNRSHRILGYVTSGKQGDFFEVEVKNSFGYGQQIEVLNMENSFFQIVQDFYIKDKDSQLVREMNADHGKRIYMRFDKKVEEFCILRTRMASNAS